MRVVAFLLTAGIVIGCARAPGPPAMDRYPSGYSSAATSTQPATDVGRADEQEELDRLQAELEKRDLVERQY